MTEAASHSDGKSAEVGAVRLAVARFDAATPREISSRKLILAGLDRLPDPFSRDAGPVHVTGSAIVLGPRGTVLHLHKRLGIWMQPGGHLEPGEAPYDAALREAREETGLPVRHVEGGPRLVHLDVHPAGEHLHLDVRYLLSCDDVEPSPPPEESQQVRWFSLDEAISLADEGLVDGLTRVLHETTAASSPGSGETTTRPAPVAHGRASSSSSTRLASSPPT
jgi:8-oxo-dGTP pyrophosphatase MutT (NUDIX family)